MKYINTSEEHDGDPTASDSLWMKNKNVFSVFCSTLPTANYLLCLARQYLENLLRRLEYRNTHLAVIETALMARSGNNPTECFMDFWIPVKLLICFGRIDTNFSFDPILKCWWPVNRKCQSCCLSGNQLNSQTMISVPRVSVFLVCLFYICLCSSVCLSVLVVS